RTCAEVVANRACPLRPGAGAIDVAFEAAAEERLEPLGDGDERGEVDARLDPLALEQEDEILGRDVARRARRVRAAAEAADRRVEQPRARLERGETVRIPGVARVVPVEPRRARLGDERAHRRGGRDADRVRQDDLRTAGEPRRELDDGAGIASTRSTASPSVACPFSRLNDSVAPRVTLTRSRPADANRSKPRSFST